MITTALRTLLGGAWSILRAIPWQVYVLALLAAAQILALSRARDHGDRAARAALAPLLAQAHADAATRLQQAADAEGRALALDAGLQQCIGTRTTMATLTSAVLAERERARAQAVRTLNTTRQELAHAYDSTADRCADQPVPDAVLRVLDLAAFGQAQPDTHADHQHAGPAAGAGTTGADRADADPSPARTRYRELASWIADGWAPSLHSCNADKASIRALEPTP